MLQQTVLSNATSTVHQRNSPYLIIYQWRRLHHVRTVSHANSTSECTTLRRRTERNQICNTTNVYCTCINCSVRKKKNIVQTYKPLLAVTTDSENLSVPFDSALNCSLATTHIQALLCYRSATRF